MRNTRRLARVLVGVCAALSAASYVLFSSTRWGLPVSIGLSVVVLLLVTFELRRQQAAGPYERGRDDARHTPE